MANVTQIDRNLQPDAVSDGLWYFDVRKPPFRLYGLYRPRDPGPFRRCPEEVAEATNEGVRYLYTNTAGARVRFRTDSRVVAIRAEYPSLCLKPHQAAVGSSGFDLFADGAHFNTFRPTVNYEEGRYSFSMEGGYASQIAFPDRKSREILIHFPTYNDVTSLYVGLEEDAKTQAPSDYAVSVPVVFYGSSITHGCSATKPGDAYPSVLSRWLDADILNLGFSGSARGEDVMANYIASLSMSAFVYDYDHNAPDAEHLRKTHERMFRIIRDAQPELPILMASRADRNPGDQADERREIILETYRRARDGGDRNVYFIDGADMYDLLDRSLCTVDGCHPTTLGFYCMAKAFYPTLEKILYPRGRAVRGETR